MRVFELWRERTFWPQAPQGTIHDYVRPEGPLPDADLVASYLATSYLLLVAGSIGYTDEATGEFVREEVGLRTDGIWLWPSQLAHYVRNRNVSPPSDLVEHIREEKYRPRLLSEEEKRSISEEFIARLPGGSLTLPTLMREAYEELIFGLARYGGPLGNEDAESVRSFVAASDPTGAWTLLISTLRTDSGCMTIFDRQRISDFAQTAGYEVPVFSAREI